MIRPWKIFHCTDEFRRLHGWSEAQNGRDARLLTDKLQRTPRGVLTDDVTLTLLSPPTHADYLLYFVTTLFVNCHLGAGRELAVLCATTPRVKPHGSRRHHFTARRQCVYRVKNKLSCVFYKFFGIHGELNKLSSNGRVEKSRFLGRIAFLV